MIKMHDRPTRGIANKVSVCEVHHPHQFLVYIDRVLARNPVKPNSDRIPSRQTANAQQLVWIGGLLAD
jgi:hypothetical protein